jgi:hypothetical protein
MIRDFEKNILKKIDFANRLLKEERGFIANGLDNPIFRKEEILNIFKDLSLPCKYETGGWYETEIKYKDYTFAMAIQLRKNTPLIYLNVFKSDRKIENGLTHFSHMLNYLSFDEKLINNKFGLNSLLDLKSYINKMITLFVEFINVYIEEIKNGNNPESTDGKS